MNTRRLFVISLLALATIPRGPAHAQSQVQHRVGIVLGDSVQTSIQEIAHLKRGMQGLGYAEPEAIEYVSRWADGFVDRLPGFARELVVQRVAVVVTSGVSAAHAILQGAPAMSVVLAGGFDPVAAGLADSLARPGRSVTGVINLSDEVAQKQLQIVRELVPSARRAGILYQATAASAIAMTRLRPAAQHLRFEVIEAGVATPAEIGPATTRLRSANVDALLVFAAPLFQGARTLLLQHTARLGVPVVYAHSGFVEAGGLLSYGPNRAGIWHRAAFYVHKILNGTRPGDLPIEQPARFDLVINLRTAKTLGLTIPKPLLLQANQIVE